MPIEVRKQINISKKRFILKANIFDKIDDKISERYEGQSYYDIYERLESCSHLFCTSWSPEELRSNIDDICDSDDTYEDKNPILYLFGYINIVEILLR